jgi:hypothetical protein
MEVEHRAGLTLSRLPKGACGTSGIQESEWFCSCSDRTLQTPQPTRPSNGDTKAPGVRPAIAVLGDLSLFLSCGDWPFSEPNRQERAEGGLTRWSGASTCFFDRYRSWLLAEIR